MVSNPKIEVGFPQHKMSQEKMLYPISDVNLFNLHCEKKKERKKENDSR